MPVMLTRDALARLFPRATARTRDELFRSHGGPLHRFQINSTKRRLAYFLAQAAEESGGFTVFEENLNYSAARMTRVWPARFPTVHSAEPYARNPEKLANKVYGGRMGNSEPGDGWRFRGRGPIQLTGRDNYRTIGRFLGLDLVGNPDLANEPEHMMLVQAGYWAKNDLNRFADRGDFIGLTRAINGGLTNLALREEWLRKVDAEMARPGSLADVAAVAPVAAVPPPPDVPLPEPPPARPAPSDAGWRAGLASFLRSIFGAR